MVENKIDNNLVLELHIPDFQKARDFYDLLGFKEIHYDPTSGGSSNLGCMVLKREDVIGNTSINFYGDKEKVSQHKYFADFPSDTPRGYAVEITIPVNNVEYLWKKVKSKLKPSQISQPLTLKRGGKKDFRVIDPFGFYLRFTEPINWDQ